METDLAWLAGFWDGEGSIGLVLDKKGVYRVQAQLTNTHGPSIEHVTRILDRLGVPWRSYHYEEKKAEHKPSWHLHIHSGMAHTRKLAIALIPYAVTKKAAWEDCLEWIERRIAAAGGLTPDGRLKRGGTPGRRSYTQDDYDLAERIRSYSRTGRLVAAA